MCVTWMCACVRVCGGVKLALRRRYAVESFVLKDSFPVGNEREKARERVCA